MRVWRHRDGGFVLQIYTRLSKLEICFARRRVNRWGVREPFTVTLNTYAELSPLESEIVKARRVGQW